MSENKKEAVDQEGMYPGRHRSFFRGITIIHPPKQQLNRTEVRDAIRKTFGVLSRDEKEVVEAVQKKNVNFIVLEIRSFEPYVNDYGLHHDFENRE